jgi:hypothetical protein
MGEAQRHSITRGEKNIKWVEAYVANPLGGYLMLTTKQCDAIRRIYDDGAPRAADSDLELAAYLRLLHLVGREARPGTTRTSRPGEFLRTCTVAKRSTLLWKHLKLHGGRLVCPATGAILEDGE